MVRQRDESGEPIIAAVSGALKLPRGRRPTPIKAGAFAVQSDAERKQNSEIRIVICHKQR
jgi:hypothetical protein|tara:strand:+ start:1515 stop:1694 length:180 start_codon:yes stop_codon:yes gene_type:complete